MTMNDPSSSSQPPRILFVTGRLAEFALRQVLDELAPHAGFQAEIAVLPISVAALMTPRWVARHLEIPPDVDRVILPGYCQGDLVPITDKARGIPVEVGPLDLRDLPRHFGQPGDHLADYGDYSLEILAEINHVPRLDRAELIRQAEQFAAEGADVIDLGCDPSGPWQGIADSVAVLRDRGFASRSTASIQRKWRRLLRPGQSWCSASTPRIANMQPIGEWKSSRYRIGRVRSMGSTRLWISWRGRTSHFVSTRSSSRSGSVLPRRLDAISRSAGDIPRQRS